MFYSWDQRFYIYDSFCIKCCCFHQALKHHSCNLLSGFLHWSLEALLIGVHCKKRYINTIDTLQYNTTQATSRIEIL